MTIREMRVVSLFDRLGSEEITSLAALTTHQSYKKGTAIFFQDDPSDTLYIVLSGSAKVFQTSEDGKDRILGIVRAGEAVGELAMLEGRPRSATVQTLEDTEVLVLTRKAFEAYAQQNPQVLWKLLQTLCERLRRMGEDVLDLSFRDVPYRLLRVLGELAERHGESVAEGRRITLDLSVKELASMVGSNAETVARLVDRYENDGLVRRNGEYWVVPDVKALQRALEYAAR
jgi:CRP-like cAMP-binding protein